MLDFTFGSGSADDVQLMSNLRFDEREERNIYYLAFTAYWYVRAAPLLMQVDIYVPDLHKIREALDAPHADRYRKTLEALGPFAKSVEANISNIHKIEALASPDGSPMTPMIFGDLMSPTGIQIFDIVANAKQNGLSDGEGWIEVSLIDDVVRTKRPGKKDRGKTMRIAEGYTAFGSFELKKMGDKSYSPWVVRLIPEGQEAADTISDLARVLAVEFTRKKLQHLQAVDPDFFNYITGMVVNPQNDAAGSQRTQRPYSALIGGVAGLAAAFAALPATPVQASDTAFMYFGAPVAAIERHIDRPVALAIGGKMAMTPADKAWGGIIDWKAVAEKFVNPSEREAVTEADRLAAEERDNVAKYRDGMMVVFEAPWRTFDLGKAYTPAEMTEADAGIEATEMAGWGAILASLSGRVTLGQGVRPKDLLNKQELEAGDDFELTSLSGRVKLSQGVEPKAMQAWMMPTEKAGDLPSLFNEFFGDVHVGSGVNMIHQASLSRRLKFAEGVDPQ